MFGGSKVEAISQSRNTKQRNLLIKCFNESCVKHLTVEGVFELAKQMDSKIGIATVYRNLKFLEQHSIIKKVELPNSITCYELCSNMDTHSHHHVICQKCGEILDFEQDLLDPVEKLIQKTKGFVISLLGNAYKNKKIKNR